MLTYIVIFCLGISVGIAIIRYSNKSKDRLILAEEYSYCKV